MTNTEPPTPRAPAIAEFWSGRTSTAGEDPLDEWLAALAFVEPGQELFINRGGNSWYANIRHQKGYTVWYMPGASPTEALAGLAKALGERGIERHEVRGGFTRIEAAIRAEADR